MKWIIRSRKRAWHERVNKCFERYASEHGRSDRKVKMSQSELVRRIRERYEDMSSVPDVSQASISRWLSIGGEGAPDANLPPTETIIMLADFFGVDVGYLLGETDFKTYASSDAARYLGITERAIDKIRLATSRETAFRDTGIWHDEASEILSKLLGSRHLFELIRAFDEMEHLYDEPDVQKRMFEELDAKYGSTMVAEALEFDPYEDDRRERPPQFVEAYKDVQAALDKMSERDAKKREAVKASRYELMRVFSRIVDELYPE